MVTVVVQLFFYVSSCRQNIGWIDQSDLAGYLYFYFMRNNAFIITFSYIYFCINYPFKMITNHFEKICVTWSLKSVRASTNFINIFLMS